MLVTSMRWKAVSHWFVRAIADVSTWLGSAFGSLQGGMAELWTSCQDPSPGPERPNNLAG